MDDISLDIRGAGISWVHTTADVIIESEQDKSKENSAMLTSDQYTRRQGIGLQTPRTWQGLRSSRDVSRT